VRSATVTGKALTDEESDALELTLPVDVPGVKLSTARGGSLNGGLSTAYDLTFPEKVEPGSSVFMVWVRGLENGAQAASQGALMVNSNLIGEMETVTPLRSFELFITPESSHTVTAPTGKILLSARIEMK